jgi:hypothetical protein
MAISAAALADFNDQLAGKLVIDAIYTGNTAEYVTVQQGIKYSQPLNLVSVTPYFQGGDAVSTPSGSADFTQRNITVTKRTAYDNWNLQLLTEKYTGKAFLPEGSYEDTMTILTEMSDDLVKKAQQNNDDFIWNAVSGAAFANSTVTPEADGFKTLISGSTSGVNVATGIGANVITGSTAYDQITTMLESVDVNVLDAPDLTVWCGTSVFQRIVNGLTTQNLFHFDPTTVERRGGFYEVPLPGYPNVKIIGTYGLRSSERVIIGPASSMVVGTDLVSDTNNFQMWYSIDQDTLNYRLRNKLGCQISHASYFVSNDQA